MGLLVFVCFVQGVFGRSELLLDGGWRVVFVCECVCVFVCVFVHVFVCVVCDLLCGVVWFVFCVLCVLLRLICVERSVCCLWLIV